MWQSFLNQLNTIDDEKRNYQVLRGFLNAASKIDNQISDDFLDHAVDDRVLGGMLPLLQTSVEISESGVGELPPIVLATLRQKMIALAGEIGDGMVFANGARSHMAVSLAALPANKRRDEDFFIANMIPTCISDDIEAAKAVNRRTLAGYTQLPNYRNYWKEAGYEEEMGAVEAVLAEGAPERIPDCLSDEWLADVTLFGPPAQVLDGLEAWRDAGIRTPILVPSSAQGNQQYLTRSGIIRNAQANSDARYERETAAWLNDESHTLGRRWRF